MGGTARAGVITTERQIIPPSFANQLALVIRLGPQLVVGGKNKGVAGPSPAVVKAKTDIAKWRCSPLDKKLELPITIPTYPPPPLRKKIFPCDSFLFSFLSRIYVTFGLDCPNVCISIVFPFDLSTMFNIIINSSKVLPTTIFNENSFSQFQFQIHSGRAYILHTSHALFFLSFECSRLLKRNSYLVMRSLKPDLILITTGVQYSDYSEPLSKKQTK